MGLNSFVGWLHGRSKQDGFYGYTRQFGYHPMLATRADTGEVLHVRKRDGRASTPARRPPVRRSAARQRPSRHLR
jgi:hypothetical protein